MYLVKKTTFIASLLAATCFAASVNATTLNLTLVATQDNLGGVNFIGDTATATLTWNPADVPSTAPAFGFNLIAVPTPFFGITPAGFDFEFTSFFGSSGQTFDDSNDPNAVLQFGATPNPLQPTSFILAINEDEPGSEQPITDPLILGFSTIGNFLFLSPDSATINVRIDDVVAPIPLPASILMLGTALAGFAGFSGMRRRKKS